MAFQWLHTNSTDDLYFVMRTALDGSYWKLTGVGTSVWEQADADNWTAYAITLPHVGGTALCDGTPPQQIDTGWYWFDVYLGDAPNVDDQLLGSSLGYWNGSWFSTQGAETALGSDLATLMELLGVELGVYSSTGVLVDTLVSAPGGDGFAFNGATSYLSRYLGQWMIDDTEHLWIATGVGALTSAQFLQEGVGPAYRTVAIKNRAKADVVTVKTVDADTALSARMDASATGVRVLLGVPSAAPGADGGAPTANEAGLASAIAWPARLLVSGDTRNATINGAYELYGTLNNGCPVYAASGLAWYIWYGGDFTWNLSAVVNTIASPSWSTNWSLVAPLTAAVWSPTGDAAGTLIVGPYPDPVNTTQISGTVQTAKNLGAVAPDYKPVVSSAGNISADVKLIKTVDADTALSARADASATGVRVLLGVPAAAPGAPGGAATFDSLRIGGAIAWPIRMQGSGFIHGFNGSDPAILNSDPWLLYDEWYNDWPVYGTSSNVAYFLWFAAGDGLDVPDAWIISTVPGTKGTSYWQAVVDASGASYPWALGIFSPVGTGIGGYVTMTIWPEPVNTTQIGGVDQTGQDVGATAAHLDTMIEVI